MAARNEFIVVDQFAGWGIARTPDPAVPHSASFQSMTATNIERLVELVSVFVEQTKQDQLLAWQEGFVKVRLAESALKLGWVLQEGTPGTDRGFPAAHILRFLEGSLSWGRVPRLFKLPEGSTDLTFVAPIQVMLEIKTRPDFGTKAGCQFQTIAEDVQRAAMHKGIAFLFVIDESSYRSFCGSKTERRGRPASDASTWFRSNFPALDDVTANGLRKDACLGDGRLWLRFWRQQPSTSRLRVVVLGGSCEPVPVGVTP